VGGQLNLNCFTTQPYQSLVGSFVLIRECWPLPTVSQIILDIQQTTTINDWIELLQTELNSLTIVNNTMNFIFLDVPDKASVQSNAAQYLLQSY